MGRVLDEAMDVVFYAVGYLEMEVVLLGYGVEVRDEFLADGLG